MRPKTVVDFEWIMFGTLPLGILHGYLDWDRIIARVTAVALLLRLDPKVWLAIELATGLPLVVTLILLVSRRRSKIAMWVLIALFALGLPRSVQTVVRGARCSNQSSCS